jgi:hypothetical protein
MKFSFEAKIYKVGINPCVKVPARITDKLIAKKGYIPVKGKINRHSFQQTLVPVKDAGYRLYVNGLMLKGSSTKVGDRVKFTIEQDSKPKTLPPPMLKEFKKQLDQFDLHPQFQKLTPSQRLEVLRYMSYLKTEEARVRNINKVIKNLQAKVNEPS